MEAEIKKSLWLTVNYFDLFDYPLKKEEIWQWLWQGNCSKQAMEQALEQIKQAGRFRENDGWYFLPGRESLSVTRRVREEISRQKIKKARIIGRVLGILPGVRMVAVCSNLGYLNADEEADIDFLVAAKRGRVWTARFWSVFLMKILKQRPNKRQTKNKICLSYFVEEETLCFEETQIGEDDIHLVYLTAQHLLIYAEGDWWQKFIRANDWIKKYLPNFSYQAPAEKWAIRKRFLGQKRWLEKIFFILPEGFYRKIQEKIMPRQLKTAAERGDQKVIIKDNILKLHLNDKRAWVKNEIFNKRKNEENIFK